MMSDYTIPAREARFEQEIRRSRFVGVAAPVTSREAVTSALDALRAEFPDASHHAWAYVLGDPRTSAHMRMDDDGEPSGTAGKPILNVLQHKNVGDVLIVVVRYFGGVKLGAGGLVRAYGSTASGVMDRVDVVAKVRERDAVLKLDYADEQPVRRLLDTHGVTVSAASYGERVELTIRFPEDDALSLAAALAESSGGRVKLHAV